MRDRRRGSRKRRGEKEASREGKKVKEMNKKGIAALSLAGVLLENETHQASKAKKKTYISISTFFEEL